MERQPLKSSEEEQEKVIGALEDRLEKHDNSRRAVQDKLHEICEELKAQIDEFEDRINKELEEKFTLKDDRLQAALNELRGGNTAGALQKAKKELLVEQSYELIEDDGARLDLKLPYKLKTERRIAPEWMEATKPTDVRVTGFDRRRALVEFTCLSPDEERVLSDKAIVNPVKYRCKLFKEGNVEESKEYPLISNEDGSFSFPAEILEADTAYGIRVKMAIGDREGEWSDEISVFTTPRFGELCAWKECPGDVDGDRKYRVDEENPRVATNIKEYILSFDNCTIIGNTPIPLNTVTSWNIKILRSKDNDGGNVYVGVAPSDINQNINNYFECGWYFNCYSSTLCSGLPHKYSGKAYGPRKGHGQYVHTGDSVGVVVDTTKGDLSFALNNVNYGVAFEGIPLDKPLVPCVTLYHPGDSVEVSASLVEDIKVDSSVPVPPSATIKDITWDSITLGWDEVADASFYQVEANESKSWHAITTNTFTKRRLLPETGYKFRVRVVKGSSVGEWGDAVKGRTLKAPDKYVGAWKECPDNVRESMKYKLKDINARNAEKTIKGSMCTVIGNTPIPPNALTSWSVNERAPGSRFELKRLGREERDIYVGVAPSDINQNNSDNYNKCGWYLHLQETTLFSGPPHNYNGKSYGPREEEREYVNTGDRVGVVMDTVKGKLSFALGEVNLGVAYEGIPLDNPLVPCVILGWNKDTIALVI